MQNQRVLGPLPGTNYFFSSDHFKKLDHFANEIIFQKGLTFWSCEHLNNGCCNWQGSNRFYNPAETGSILWRLIFLRFQCRIQFPSKILKRFRNIVHLSKVFRFRDFVSISRQTRYYGRKWIRSSSSTSSPPWGCVISKWTIAAENSSSLFSEDVRNWWICPNKVSHELFLIL